MFFFSPIFLFSSVSVWHCEKTLLCNNYVPSNLLWREFAEALLTWRNCMNCAIPQQLHYKLRVKNPGGWLLKESFRGGGALCTTRGGLQRHAIRNWYNTKETLPPRNVPSGSLCSSNGPFQNTTGQNISRIISPPLLWSHQICGATPILPALRTVWHPAK